MANLCVGKAVMACSNAVFLVSGIAAVVLGALLLADAPRVLMSRLILSPASGAGSSLTLLPPQPLLYYASLAAMGLGLVVCAVAVLGCWASCLHSYCILGSYLFLLTLLLLGELAVGVVAALSPHYLGLAVEQPRLTDALQRGYGVPGREQFTAAFDLAQVSLRCCGVAAGSDFQASWWHLRELGQRGLVVPLSCCDLNNAKDPDSFLDPKPANLTLCQALQQEAAMPHRHMEGCGPKISQWLSEQVQSMASVGAGLVLVQLVALLTAILVCVQLPRCRHKQALQEMQSRLTPRSENGFLDYNQDGDDKFVVGDSLAHADVDHANTLLSRTSRVVPTYSIPVAGTRNTNTAKFLMKDIVDSSVYHLPLPREITPMVPPPYHQSKYFPPHATEEVVYQQTNCGTVKYSLPQLRDSDRPPKPPLKGVPMPCDTCSCDLQKLYQQCYDRFSVLEPSPYEYVEEVRASAYQQALASGAAAATKRPTRQKNPQQPQKQQQQQQQPLPQLQPQQQQQQQQQQQPPPPQKQHQQQPQKSESKSRSGTPVTASAASQVSQTRALPEQPESSPGPGSTKKKAPQQEAA